MTRPRHRMSDDDTLRTMDDFASLMAEFKDIRARAKAAGVFLDDRELIQCQTCGLMEDVTAYGSLITCHDKALGEDSGLRFEPLDIEGWFRCPSCGVEVEEPLDPEDDQAQRRT